MPHFCSSSVVSCNLKTAEDFHLHFHQSSGSLSSRYASMSLKYLFVNSMCLSQEPFPPGHSEVLPLLLSFQGDLSANALIRFVRLVLRFWPRFYLNGFVKASVSRRSLVGRIFFTSISVVQSKGKNLIYRQLCRWCIVQSTVNILLWQVWDVYALL